MERQRGKVAGRYRERDTERSRVKKRYGASACNQDRREVFDRLDDPDAEDLFPKSSLPSLAIGEVEQDPDDCDDSDRLGVEEEDESPPLREQYDTDDFAPKATLKDLFGATVPPVLFSLTLCPRGIEAKPLFCGVTTKDKEGIEELGQFLEHVFSKAEGGLCDEDWRRLTGQRPCTAVELWRALAKAAIPAGRKMVARRDRYKPGDRGTERYRGKLFLLPDGTPVSFGLLLADNRGRGGKSWFAELPLVVRWLVVREALDAEAKKGKIRQDEGFATAYVIPRLDRWGLLPDSGELQEFTWKDAMAALRKQLKRNGLSCFPSYQERQEQYDKHKQDRAPHA